MKPKNAPQKARLSYAIRLRVLQPTLDRLTAPDVNSCEQEQPNNVNKVPVPCRRFEAQMGFLGKVAACCAHVADEQEDCSNNNVEAVEARRHKEVCAVDVASKTERCMLIFIRLEHCKDEAKNNRNDQAVLEVLTIVFLRQSVVRPSRRSTGTQ